MGHLTGVGKTLKAICKVWRGQLRKAVRLPVHRSSTQVWAELHERAFRRRDRRRVLALQRTAVGLLKLGRKRADGGTIREARGRTARLPPARLPAPAKIESAWSCNL